MRTRRCAPIKNRHETNVRLTEIPVSMNSLIICDCMHNEFTSAFSSMTHANVVVGGGSDSGVDDYCRTIVSIHIQMYLRMCTMKSERKQNPNEFLSVFGINNFFFILSRPERLFARNVNKVNSTNGHSLE